MSHSEEFKLILARMQEIHDSKNADYGAEQDSLSNFRLSERVGIPAWVGAFIRSGDKRARIETFINRGRLSNESVEDTLLDYANYIILTLILYRETQVTELLKEGYDTQRHAAELYGKQLTERFENARREQKRNH